MKQVLHVDIKDYDIEISDNKIEKIKDRLDFLTSGKKRLFVISKKVYHLYKKVLQIDDENIVILPDGEKEKNIKNYLKIQEAAYRAGLTRNDIIIAIGGGVIGDIAGFAASTYMRGIDYIQIPTTLLSIVDSSVGGKTAIDINNTKNIIGTFWQPKRVLININFLKTLDKKQFMSGVGEVLKYGFIEKSCEYEQPIFLFEYLTLCCDKLFEFDSVTLMRVIDYCLKLKISVVNKDEKETGLRRVLNFGHTLGHALESITGFKKFSHGEAVVYGMFFAIYLAYKTDLINYSYYRLSTELLESYGFKNIKIKKYNADKIIEAMKHDKKASTDKILFVLPCEKKLVKNVKLTPEEVKDFLVSVK